MKKKFLKLCISEWYNFSRDKRELSVVGEFADVDIRVMAKGGITGEIDIVNGYKVERITTRPYKKLPVKLNRLLSVFVWINYVRQYNADIISGHDYTALVIAYLSNIFKSNKKKAKLVYDCHEFTIGLKNRSAVNKLLVKKLEKFLMKKCVFSIMVTDVIAEKVTKEYNLKESPVVVRNIPNKWNLDEGEIRQKREAFTKKLNVAENAFILMYHGAVYEHRGIENMLYAIAKMPDVVGVVLGSSGREEYKESIYTLCKELSIEKRVLFEEAVDVLQLYKYVGASDVGFVTLTPVNENHILALPNKFFENIQSLTPVIVSDFPSLARITDNYKIGIKVDPENLEDIINAINKMKDEETYSEFKKNLKTAKEELCWENEKEVLHKAYSKIL